MLRRIHRSLLVQLGFALSLMATMALFGIVTSVIIAEQLRGAATAINHAGTLRYSTYAASTTALRPEVEDAARHRADLEAALERFERHYRSEALQRLVPSEASHPARRSYDEVGRIWDAEMRPLILGFSAVHPDGAGYRNLRVAVDDFVELVDRMVLQLEQRTEAFVQVLRGVQAACLLMTVLVMLYTVGFLRRQVMRPLRELLAGAEEVRHGDFTRHVAHTGRDELGQLGAAFNRMTRDLSRLYGDLEERVREKTRALEYSNRSLELMYRSLSHLHDGSLNRATYTDTLREMEQVLGLGHGSLCLLEQDGRKGFQLANSGTSDDSTGPLCDRLTCAACIDDAREGPQLKTGPDGHRVVSVPLFDGGELHALLQMTVPGETRPEPWQLQLVAAIGRHLGVAIASQRRALQGRRLALLEERATIARELHDSLAQALSYLKIQVSRLRAALRGSRRNEEVEAALQELHHGLNDAYGQLRELLTTFRIGRGGEGLGRTLEETAAGIAARGPIEITLENRLADGELNINEEIHVLQIVREALCNVLRHARASHAWVRLEWAPEGVLLTIRDDGIGIGIGIGIGAGARDKSDHYGLSIMRERARQLHGTISVEPVRDGGTCVELRFRPAPAPVPQPAEAARWAV
ncbi:Nitrate/nitrite sensor protein [Thioalkalivibrio nitratireducens DSM 14787]|uniref:Sensor protein n=1 Tax=Thioalkalivibrio nitratireducens (strain DSM 14787 / UNIQEM 213 / ALEN2) TaxID=1255043 RepID=L0DSL1_THIND|nr:histidine kinase [Thioalkalivibrio nitratireducens]AGA31982.1 Nitrate/nitrite sensor protein [Thioalkalivibrio nitratireducens DSM 14787]